MRSSQRPLYAKHCSYYSSTHIHAKAWAHVLKNIGTPIMELLYFIHSWFFNDMHRLYLYVDVWRVLSPIYLIQGLGFISHGLCVLIYVFQHVESASPAWVLLGHTCLWLLMRGANTNQCINIVVVATPYNPQLRDFQLWKNPHPWVRPSPSGYLELICKSFLMIDLSLSSHSSSTKGIQYLRILHALCLPTQSLSTFKFWVYQPKTPTLGFVLFVTSYRPLHYYKYEAINIWEYYTSHAWDTNLNLSAYRLIQGTQCLRNSTPCISRIQLSFELPVLHNVISSWWPVPHRKGISSYPFNTH